MSAKVRVALCMQMHNKLKTTFESCNQLRGKVEKCFCPTEVEWRRAQESREEFCTTDLKKTFFIENCTFCPQAVDKTINFPSEHVFREV